MSALDELRENFRAAAARDIAARRRKRRRRRSLGALAVVLVGGSAVAGAADLISVGEPTERPVTQKPSYQASGDRTRITLRAKGLDGGPSYGLIVYTSKAGQVCALVGQLRGGYELGTYGGGQFHPYPADAPASCGDPAKGVSDTLQLGGAYAAFGIAPPDARLVRSGKVTEPPGPKRAVLFIYRGKRPPQVPITWVRSP